jgi:ankyrin repeat protein
VNSFWVAAFYGHLDVMRFLMQKGIDILSTNQNGSNALHIAVKKENINVVQVLLDIKYPLNYTKNNGVTALGVAAYKGNI